MQVLKDMGGSYMTHINPERDEKGRGEEEGGKQKSRACGKDCITLRASGQNRALGCSGCSSSLDWVAGARDASLLSGPRQQAQRQRGGPLGLPSPALSKPKVT